MPRNYQQGDSMSKIGACNLCPVTRLQWRLDAMWLGEFSHSEFYHTKIEARHVYRIYKDLGHDVRFVRVTTKIWCRYCSKKKGVHK